MVYLVDGANSWDGKGTCRTNTYTVMLESETVEVHKAKKTEVDEDGDSEYIRDDDATCRSSRGS
jgi:hypothetical protein